MYTTAEKCDIISEICNGGCNTKMSRKIIMAGHLTLGIPKPENMQEIIDEVNLLKINKKKKYIYLLACLTILSPIKNKQEIIKQLQLFIQKGEIVPNFSNNKYISSILSQTQKMGEHEFIQETNELIEYLKK